MKIKSDDYKVVKYSKEFYSQWNDFITNSKNGTFLFHRDFMEYHSDRFEDHSLLVFKKNRLVAVFPANKKVNEIHSHEGLSYGGFVLTKQIRGEVFSKLLNKVLSYFLENDIKRIYIKEVPFIYHSRLSQEFEFYIQFLNYQIVQTDSYYVIDNSYPIKINRNRKRALKTAEDNRLIFTQEGLEYFWNIVLEKNLRDKFNVSPVHTFEEIKMLMQRFPDNIKFYAVSKNGEILAGALMFINKSVAHFQYSSGSDNRAETGALDFLFNSIIEKYKTCSYISFGSSATDKTLRVDRGLAYWKESFDANLMPQRTVAIDTKSKINLDEIFK